MGMHGVGHRRCQVELRDLLPHIPRHKLDRGLHFRNHPRGFVDPLQAGLTETFVLRHAANRVHLCLDIGRNELAIATHAVLEINKVVGMTNGADALGHLLALGADALQRLVGRLRCLRDLLQACGGFEGAARSLLVRRVVRVLKLPLDVLKPLLSRGGRLCSRPLLGGQGA